LTLQCVALGDLIEKFGSVSRTLQRSQEFSGSIWVAISMGKIFGVQPTLLVGQAQPQQSGSCGMRGVALDLKIVR
jgi:hypothetical protein